MNYRQPFSGDYGISQGFGKTEYSKNHTGIDFLCPSGTPILASEAGKVFYTGWKNGGYGYCVFVTHPDGYTTIYEHLLADIQVSVGQQVAKGQLIGFSGSTGNSTGAHLHFEVRDSEGKPVDPMSLLHSVDDSVELSEDKTSNLKGAETLGEKVEIVAPKGAWGWSQDFSKRQTIYPCGTKLYYTGNTAYRLGYTYCECYTEPPKYWVAVHDNDCQILDNVQK